MRPLCDSFEASLRNFIGSLQSKQLIQFEELDKDIRKFDDDFRQKDAKLKIADIIDILHDMLELLGNISLIFDASD